jgi:hypothetical protein
VDSITLKTRKGQSFKVGGDGGGESISFDIPDDQMICGFYGGTGGHLHNIGVILCDFSVADDTPAAKNYHEERENIEKQVSSPMSYSTAAADFVIYIKESLLNFCCNLSLWNCGLLNSRQNVEGVPNFSSDIGKLISLTCRLFMYNNFDIAKNCLKTIVSYLSNMNKDLKNRKMQSIKSTNAVFNRTVLLVKGLI